MKRIILCAAVLPLFLASCVSMKDTLARGTGTAEPSAPPGAAEPAPKGTRNAVVEAAKKQLDKYYAYGKQDEFAGFDCSALAQYAYSEAGIKIPRTVKLQYNAAKKISREELKSGDLVFFTTYAPGATHVGIYIGGGRFIHSPTTGKKVDISELANVYWNKAFITGGSFISE